MLKRQKAEDIEGQAFPPRQERKRMKTEPNATNIANSAQAVDDLGATESPLASSPHGRQGRLERNDEIECVGCCGTMALRDLPHTRKDCLVVPYSVGTEQQYCAQCYCYVCDNKASECPRWSDHCTASHESVVWRQVRATTRKNNNMRRSNVSAHKTVEIQAPPGFCGKLQPYQNESLAFMLDLEHAPDGDERVGCGHRRGPVTRGGWLCDEVGMGKTVVTIALILANPSTRAPPTDAIWQRFSGPDGPMSKYCYKTGDLMHRISNAPELGDQIILLSNLASSKYVVSEKPKPRWCGGAIAANEWTSFLTSLSPVLPFPVIQLKATLILTKVTLIGQWQDELKIFAPSLKVVTLHRSSKDRVKALTHYSDLLRDADVILSSMRSKLPNSANDYIQFHRVVVDESHAPDERAFENCTMHLLWGLTATPEAGSLALINDVLGHSRHGLRVTSIDDENASKLMIRHTKSQAISSIPPLQSRTLWLNMDQSTRSEYDEARSKYWKHRVFREQKHVYLDTEARQFTQDKSKLGSVACLFQFVRKICALSKLKTDALCSSLHDLYQQDPFSHAVVFTEHNDVHAKLVQAVRLRCPKLKVYEIVATTRIEKRHTIIRQFQAQELVGKVIIITLKAGSCGITLTAANRVYLMEPWLNPAHETQAAGRIHRLGQFQDTLVTRFCFRASYEEQVSDSVCEPFNKGSAFNDDSHERCFRFWNCTSW